MYQWASTERVFWGALRRHPGKPGHGIRHLSHQTHISACKLTYEPPQLGRKACYWIWHNRMSIWGQHISDLYWYLYLATSWCAVLNPLASIQAAFQTAVYGKWELKCNTSQSSHLKPRAIYLLLTKEGRNWTCSHLHSMYVLYHQLQHLWRFPLTYWYWRRSLNKHREFLN